MKVVPKDDSFADFQCPACLCWIDDFQTIFDPYNPSTVGSRADVPVSCPGCGKGLLVGCEMRVSFSVRLAIKDD